MPSKPIRVVWRNMIRRCADKGNTLYGGRGITVCQRWLDSFDAFCTDMGPRPVGASREWSIERIDNNGNYEPSNCCWATRKQQTNNRRVTKFIEFRGERKTLRDWCDALGLPYKTIKTRIHDGWTVSDALTAPTMEEAKRGEAVIPLPHKNAGKTHCKRGHAFDADNTAILSGGRRECIKCRSINGRARYVKRIAAGKALKDALVRK